MVKNSDKLYYKKIIKKKGTDNRYETFTEEFYIPKIEELKTCHGNYKDLKNLFYEKKIGYLGFDSILQQYVNQCSVCIQTSRTIHRLDPIIPINVEGPDFRYMFDINYLNADQAECFGIKYILSILDVFSRKGMIYGINTKRANILLNYIKEFCLYNIIPRQFASDNGAKFKNSIFNSFCKENNIEFIHGLPYGPHSQGSVERFNYTIKKYLGKEFISNGEQNLDFENCRFKIINYYNNKIHMLIGTTPYKAYKIMNEDDVKKINDIKSKECNKINKKRNYLVPNDKCLLNPKFIKIGKRTLISNSLKKGKIDSKIPIKIIKNSSFGYYLIKICKNYSDNKTTIEEGEEYIADCVLLKKINDKTWNAIASCNINDNKKKNNKKKSKK